MDEHEPYRTVEIPPDITCDHGIPGDACDQCSVFTGEILFKDLSAKLGIVRTDGKELSGYLLLVDVPDDPNRQWCLALSVLDGAMAAPESADLMRVPLRALLRYNEQLQAAQALAADLARTRRQHDQLAGLAALTRDETPHE